MPCERVRALLTGYLDGELDGDSGTVVRGHLRTCAACRAVAGDEAALRDGLRSLTPFDPPHSLWAGVQAQLAVEEVAESQLPAWRRALARWLRWMPAPRVAIAGALAAAAAVGVIGWQSRSAEVHDEPIAHVRDVPVEQRAPDVPETGRQPAALAPASCEAVADAADVTADIELDNTRVYAAYDCAIQELMREAQTARRDWSDGQRAAFDDRVRAMREAIATAGDGKPKKRATRALVTYIQGAVARDQILLAGVQ